MKQVFIGIGLLAIGVGLIQLSGCGGDPEPDPCLEKVPINADFTISEALSDPLINKVSLIVSTSDTVLVNNTIVFEAKEKFATYEWKIGEDRRSFNEKSVTLRFTEPFSNIKVQLIVTKKPDNFCFSDDGVDTLTRNLTVEQQANPIFGEYEGVLLSAPTDVFTVSIIDTTIRGFRVVEIQNINKGCFALDYWTFGLESDVGYRVMSFGNFPGNRIYLTCNDPIGWATVDKNGYLLVDFSTAKSGDALTRIKNKFYGRRK